jgi:hypothetical protein
MWALIRTSLWLPTRDSSSVKSNEDVIQLKCLELYRRMLGLLTIYNCEMKPLV